MSPDRPGGGTEESNKTAKATSKRDDKRAAALRANLQRRKAQARGRADSAGEPTPSTSEGGDPQSD